MPALFAESCSAEVRDEHKNQILHIELQYISLVSVWADALTAGWSKEADPTCTEGLAVLAAPGVAARRGSG